MACPHCGKKLKVRDDLVGRTARCPHCRGAVAVQRPSSNELDQLDQEEERSVDLFGSAPAAPKPGGSTGQPLVPKYQQIAEEVDRRRKAGEGFDRLARGMKISRGLGGAQAEPPAI